MDLLEHSASESDPEDDLSKSAISSCGEQEYDIISADQTTECAGTEKVSEVTTLSLLTLHGLYIFIGAT